MLRMQGVNVLVRVDYEPLSKVILVVEEKKQGQQGVVLAVGQRRLADGSFVPLSVSVGDRILFGKFSGDKVKASDWGLPELDEAGNKIEYRTLRELEILGVME